ncbi:MAG: hypothetical protein ACR2QX_05895 [Woeseiaceae bacterium]
MNLPFSPLAEQRVDGFIRSHRLPDAFRGVIEQHYLPLLSWVAKQRRVGATMLLGINGAQGTGKSTLADFLKLVLESGYSWKVAVLSIDDFYLTKAERLELAETVHALLATRGVPGTHDIVMLNECLDRLRSLGQDDTCHLPRFDKARDDRADPSDWPIATGPVDLIILEGWCVGSVAESGATLMRCVNALEREQDPSGDWRRYANDRLNSDYASLFSELDVLVFLQAPSFDAIYRWRLEQEEKLRASAPADASAIMSAPQIAEFVQFYERITRANLEHLPQFADVVLELDENHNYVASRYRG